MRKFVTGLFLIVLIGAAAFAFYLWRQGPTYVPPSPPAEAPPPPPVAATEPEIRYPLPETAEQPLPPLEKSDSEALAALREIFGAKAVKQFFVPQEVIRRIVVTVDNLPRKVVSAQLLPTTRLKGKFRIEQKGETTVMAPSNFARYTPFIRLAEAVDAKTLVSVYIRFYPLFQQAYRDLGYPKGYFNDRLVAVIDHMLAAPEAEGPLALVQPHVFYKFADPDLETLSAGHKLMLRMGSENAAKVKAKLQEIRAELVAQAPEKK
jgi:hypothetical protein